MEERLEAQRASSPTLTKAHLELAAKYEAVADAYSDLRVMWPAR